MTKLAIINIETYKKDVNEIGDIVGIFSDDHVFSDDEKVAFDIVIVEETKTMLDIKLPETKHLSKATTTEWTDVEPERKSVWKDIDGEFKDIIVQPKYPLMYDPDKKEVKETYSRYPENLTVQTFISEDLVIK